MEKTVVYKCTVDEQIYIGITTNLAKRIKAHFRESKNLKDKKSREFLSALAHSSNVSWEVLEECETFNDACHREKYWIAQFNSKECGLNMTLGGQGTYGSKRPKNKKWRDKHSKRMKENNPDRS